MKSSVVVTYTLARLGLLLVVLLALFVVAPGLDPFVMLLVAILVSFALSWFVFRGWRERVAQVLAESARRRREERERLRAALAGEDPPSPDAPPSPGAPPSPPSPGAPPERPSTPARPEASEQS